MAKYPLEGISEEELIEELHALLQHQSETRESDRIYDDVGAYLNEVIKSKTISEKTAKIIADNLGEYYKKQIRFVRDWEKINYLVELHKKYFSESNLEELTDIRKQISKLQKEGVSLEDSIIDTFSSLAFEIICHAKCRKEK